MAIDLHLTFGSLPEPAIVMCFEGNSLAITSGLKSDFKEKKYLASIIFVHLVLGLPGPAIFNVIRVLDVVF